MEIKMCDFKTKCDIGGCKNIATFDFTKQEDKKFGIKICDICAKDLYDCLNKIHTPKSVPAPFKNQKKIRSNV